MRPTITRELQGTPNCHLNSAGFLAVNYNKRGEVERLSESALMNDNEEFIQEFLEESDENLDQLDRDFVELESNPCDRERLASVFRVIHTIKGTSGFFAFSKLGAIAHAGENLLARLRDGELLLDGEIASALLESVDAIREILANIATTGQEGDRDFRALSDKLHRLHSREVAPPTPSADASDKHVSQAAPAGAAPVESPQPNAKTSSALTGGEAINVAQQSEASATNSAADAVARSESSAATTPDSTPPAATATAAATETTKQQVKPATSPANWGLSEGSVRVDVGLLNKLMNLVGELVLARNQLLQFTRNTDDRPFMQVSQRLNLIATELQQGVMKTRMQPMSSVWSKFPRIVRDLALSCGKEVRLEMEGDETELDRSLVEAIKDPLTHLIRNAIDHGVEAPQERITRGKPRVGRLLLRAYHEGGQVNIEVGDDGGGIPLERIKQKALDRNLITRDQAAVMGDRAMVNLIFHPGFSTAKTVTDVSGRGVGMDVVRTNIERIGGSIELDNRPGHGTTIRIRIPLTLAIIPALIVTSGGERFAIPQASLVELLSFPGEAAERNVERVHHTPVLRLRGQLLPLIFLNQELRLAETQRTASLHVVVLNAQNRPFGLVVDGIKNTEEIVVKPLDASLASLQVYSGATIMGDGRVALILDVGGLSRCGGMVAQDQLPAEPSEVPVEDVGQSVAEDVLLLLCESSGGRQIAVPLAQVARLEEFPRLRIERSANSEVVQYRGDIMPLVRLSHAAETSSAPSDSIHVVVAEYGGRKVGVVVDRILDIVRWSEENREAAQSPTRPRTIVIDQRVTDLVDLPGLIRMSTGIAG